MQRLDIFTNQVDMFLIRSSSTTFKAPQSFTGENTVEFSCHGNPLIVDEIINLAIEYGARIARAGEFTRQSVLNGKMSMLKAEL